MIKGIDYPNWLTSEGLKMLSKNYLLDGENVFAMYRRISHAAAKHINKPQYEHKFYDAFCNNWLCPATPIASNLGSDRGLPISCYGNTVNDSINGIYDSLKETALLSKSGGGVGVNMSHIRGRGKPIKGGANGNSEGVVPWIKIYDSSVIATSQGSIRRGACAINLDIHHTDINEYLKIRRQTGDANRQCLNIHHSVTVDHAFMAKLKDPTEKETRDLWLEILKTRIETGEPFILFKDNVNNGKNEAYVNNNLIVESTNICTEITLFTDDEHSFVCCLSSLNLARYEEWKDSDLVKTAVYFLEGALSEYIDKASTMLGHEKTVRSAIKGRAIGVGVLGWHSLLQSKNLAFGSFEASMLNNIIHKQIANQTLQASEDLAKEFGEPQWCKGTGRRHSHLTAIAPTRSNSIISGSVSYGVEPIPTNCYIDRTSTGSTIKRNPLLEKLFISKGVNNDDLWSNIIKHDGSVQQLDQSLLTDEEKLVYLTAYELNQHDIIKQAGARQRYVDQAQSINLFFPPNAHPSYVHEVHHKAWELGLKSLYYCRTKSVLVADSSSRAEGELQKKRDMNGKVYRSFDECIACEG